MAQFNFRLFLKPTAIGKAIIERLSAEGAERQADSRRWIELGYALEQAGFRLDGATLYLGGRPFVAEHMPSVQIPVSTQEATVARAPAHQAVAAVAEPLSTGDSFVAAAAPASPAARPVESALPKSASHVPAAPPPPPQPATDDDEMANNLRGLSA